MSSLVTALRTDLELVSVPFLTGERAHQGDSTGHRRLVNQRPLALPNTEVVSAHDIVVDLTDTL